MFREIQKKDEQEFLAMEQAFYGGAAVLHAIPQAYMRRTFEEVTSGSPYAKCYLFEEEGKICGYGLLSFTYSNEVGGRVVLLEEIYIKDEFRGKGIGSRFIQFVINQHPAERYRLEVSEENRRAEQLYERLGFQCLPYRQMVLEKKS